MIAALALWLFIRAAPYQFRPPGSRWVAYARRGLLNKLLPSLLLNWSQKAMTAWACRHPRRDHPDFFPRWLPTIWPRTKR